MQLDVFTMDGKKIEAVNVSEQIFDRHFNEPLVHQVVTAYLAGGRQGSKKQKTRAEVSGGGAKPWRQKGTGRARAGTTRSPLWRHGGVVFAATPRDHSQKVNRKMYQGAIKSILSKLARDNKFFVLDHLSLETHKTKGFLSVLQQLKIDNPLIILETLEGNDNLILSTRNLHQVSLATVNMLDPISLLSCDSVLITKSALLTLNEALSDE